MIKHIRVVSISLGSPRRNYSIILQFKGQQILLERYGCQGSMELAADLVRRLDGKVAALGLGGANFYYHLSQKRYPCPAGMYLAKLPKHTPIFDGWGWKQYGEPLAISSLQEKLQLNLKNKRALVVSVLDRYWLAASLEQSGCRVWAGDPFFGLKIPILLPFHLFCRAALVTMPLLAHLPLNYLYSGVKKPFLARNIINYFFAKAEIIAGDWHFISRYLPGNLKSKIIITSGTTVKDRELLRNCGASYLTSTTPILKGISPAANAVEAVLAALSHNSSPENYPHLAASLGWLPQVIPLVN